MSMVLGMLWFDNDPKKPLEVKIDEAARYYRAKYGAQATSCMVGSKDAAGLPAGPSGAGNVGACNVGACNGPVPIRVGVMREMRPGNLWIGMDEESKK